MVTLKKKENLNIAETSGVIRVVIVDDHEIVRQGVKEVLSRDAGIKVVGEADSSNGAILLIDQLQPDIVLTDIRLKKGNGIDVSRAARNIAPNTRVLVLSAYDDDQYVNKMMRLGVIGYMLKTDSGRELTRAIHDAVNGRLVFSPVISDKIRNIFQNMDDDTIVNSHLADMIDITARERQVLGYVANGLKNSEIADQMIISSKTVESHIAHIMKKLKVKSRTQAVLLALNRGLLGDVPQ